MGYLTRAEAVAAVGVEVVDLLDITNYELTGITTDDGTVEFSASIDLVRHEVKSEFGHETMTAYYYQDEYDAITVENLDDLDWTVYGYKID
jgi:hypothetical protein